MKKQDFYPLLLAGLLVGGSAAMSSCSDDSSTTNPSVNADKTKLSALIDSVTTVHANAVEGTKPGTYSVGSKAPLKTALDASVTVKNDNAATQTVVNTSESSLRRAAKTFQANLIQEVSAANLVAQWKFDGNTNDATANANNGMLKSGPTGPAATPGDGGVLPTLVADRFGRANRAYAFKDGAYIEVPYKASLNPQAITISAWVKRDDTNANNYIISLDRWHGYKFQLQGADKPFLTVSTTAGITDKDAESGIVGQNAWTHVVSSYTDGTMKFYINGAMVKTWTGISGALKALPKNINMAIGQQLPKDVYNSTAPAGESAGYYEYYGPAFFKGQMDDIRIYNRALTDAEVNSIYTIEKDQ